MTSLSAILGVVRVGIVTLGADAASAGDTHAALERAVAGVPGMTATAIAGPSIVAAGIPVPATDPAKKKEADDILQTATDAFYDGRTAVALDKLGALTGLHDQGNLPLQDRVRLQLWKVTVFLALNDAVQAAAEAKAALVFSPDLVVDESEFRPSVTELVASVRRAGLKMVTLTVGGLPETAILAIDGKRSLARAVRVPAGRHRVTSTAPGRRSVVVDVDVAADRALAMTLPLALSSEIEAKLAGMCWSEAGPSSADASTLTGLGDGLDFLLVGISRSEPPSSRAVLIAFAPGAASAVSPLSATASAPAILATWATTALRAPPKSRGVRTPPPRVASSGGVHPVLRAGVAVTQRTRTLSSDSRSSIETVFTGAGPRLSAELSRGSFFGEGDARYADYSTSVADVRLPDGTSTTVNGGSTFGLGVWAGWAQRIGAGRLRAGAGFGVERHSAAEVRDPAAGDLGVLASYQRLSPAVRMDGRFPLAGVVLMAGFDVEPMSAWTESPSKSTGTSPKAGLGLGWQAGAGLTLGRRWQVDAVYAGSRRSVSFGGEAAVPVTPPFEDATIHESFHSIAISARLAY